MPTRNYKELLFEELQDLEFAAGYLSECLKEDEAAFLLGLRDVVDAHGGIGALATKTELNREGLYRMLSESGNPTISSLLLVLSSLGIDLQFTVKPQDSEAA